jgi:hypothetical protein
MPFLSLSLSHLSSSVECIDWLVEGALYTRTHTIPVFSSSSSSIILLLHVLLLSAPRVPFVMIHPFVPPLSFLGWCFIFFIPYGFLSLIL